MAEVRHASVVWNGGLTDGSGMITYLSSGVISRLPVTWASRTSAHQGKTSPEELLAASHAACFSMALSSRLAKNGTPPTQLDVRADVTLDNSGGGWKVGTSKLTVTVDAPGLDDATLQRLAEDAKDNCPISQAIKGNVEISVHARLAAG
ncbi:MAG TPA: OsmC family peroxiredoxin [Candidatus Limnocylindrales bacterium]